MFKYNVSGMNNSDCELQTLLSHCIEYFENCIRGNNGENPISIVKEVKAESGLVIPIPWFGDSDAFFNSKLKIVTVGLNPSGIEFTKSKDKREKSINGKWQKRFSIDRAGYLPEELKAALDRYFVINPYMGWFDNFEQVLAGVDASYFKNKKSSVSLHLDLLSPLATKPTWSCMENKDQTNEKRKLGEEGKKYFERTLEILKPDIIIFGVGYSHLKKSNFGFLKSGEIIFCEATTSAKGNVTKKIVRAHSIEKFGKVILLTNGSAFNKPFGNYSPDQMYQAGKSIREKYQSLI
jgi:hypothetical protein